MRPDARTRMQGDLNLRFTFSSQKVNCVLGRGVIRFDDTTLSSHSVPYDMTRRTRIQEVHVDQSTYEQDVQIRSRHGGVEKELDQAGVRK